MTFKPDSSVITVFGSGVSERGSSEYLDAEELGLLLAGAGFAVCNGGYGGTMEAVAKGARSAGGHTIGVVLDYIPDPANMYIQEEVRAVDLFDRLRTLLNRGAAFVVLPGGSGTLAELALALEFNRKGLSSPAKRIVLLGDFWRPTIQNIIEYPTRNLSVGPNMASAVCKADSPSQAVKILQRHLGR
jgi:uncharacterized protein (TIGR00730 family)